VGAVHARAARTTVGARRVLPERLPRARARALALRHVGAQEGLSRRCVQTVHDVRRPTGYVARDGDRNQHQLAVQISGVSPTSDGSLHRALSRLWVANSRWLPFHG